MNGVSNHSGWRTVSKIRGLGEHIHWFRVDRSPCWCGRKAADSCNNISGFKNIRIHVEHGLRIQLNAIFA